MPAQLLAPKPQTPTTLSKNGTVSSFRSAPTSRPLAVSYIKTESDSQDTVTEITKTATAKSLFLTSGDEQLLVEYFGISSKDAILGLYEKVLSYPNGKPPISSHLTINFPENDQHPYTRMIQDVRRIFNSRLEAEYNPKTGGLRIYESSKGLCGTNNANVIFDGSEIASTLVEALPVAYDGVSTSATARNFTLSSEDERLLISHFGNHFKSQILKFYARIIADPHASSGPFGSILSDPISGTSQPYHIQHDIHRIFNDKLKTQFVYNETFHIRVFATVDESQKGGRSAVGFRHSQGQNAGSISDLLPAVP